MTEKLQPESQTLEDLLNQLEKRKDKHKIDKTRFLPVGWSRLTDEQRKLLQEMIYNFLEINKNKK